MSRAYVWFAASAVLLSFGGTAASSAPIPQAAPNVIEDFESGTSGVFSAGSGTTLQVVGSNGVVPAIEGSLSGSATGDQAGTGGGTGVSDLVIFFTFIVEPGVYNVSVDVQAISQAQPTVAADASFDPNGVLVSHSFEPAEFVQVAPDEWASPVFTLTAPNVDASSGTISGTLNLDGAFRWLFDNLRVEPAIPTPEALLAQIEQMIVEFLGTGEIHQTLGGSLLGLTGRIGEALAAGNFEAAFGEVQALLNHVNAQLGKKIKDEAEDELPEEIVKLKFVIEIELRRKGRCSLKCEGDVSKPVIDYAVTDQAWGIGSLKGELDKLAPEKEVRKEIEPTLEDNVKKLKDKADCKELKWVADGTGGFLPEGEDSMLATAKVSLRLGSALSASEGPLQFTVAAPTAIVGAEGGGTTGFVAISTGKPNKEGGLDPLEAKSKGFLTHRLEASGVNFKILSCASVYALTGGASVVREVANAEELAFILNLVNTVKDAILALFPEKVREPIDETLGRLLDASLNLSGTSEYGLTVKLNASTVSINASTSVEVVMDENAEFLEGFPKPKNTPLSAVANILDGNEANPIEVKFESDGLAKSMATGQRGLAISSTGNLWGYISLMECRPQGGEGEAVGEPHFDMSFARNSALFGLKELDLQGADESEEAFAARQAKVANLVVFQRRQNAFLDHYDEAIKVILNMPKTEDKIKELRERHPKLSNDVNAG